ncbi:MAG: glycogen synthase [Truepera sp.]|nr:glycogen synthase [Truepera sp.]
MKVLFVSSEVYPYSKSGGLGDVAGALPQALVKAGHEVLVVSPWYQTLKGAPMWIGDVVVPFDGGFSQVGVGTLEQQGVSYAFVGHREFQRDQLYGYPDDVKRFCLFSRAVPQVAERVGFVPDVVHANDWHSAYLPLILKDGWHLPAGFPGLACVYSIHNLQYQGVSELEATLYWLRLPSSLKNSYLNHFGSANAMQGAIGFAEQVTTVSPSYAAEIQRPEYGYGLDGTLRHLSFKLRGILNGLDTAVWNPASDPNLPAPYSADDLSGKQQAREALCERFGLGGGRPILGVVSRLVEQKGIDLVLKALPQLLGQGWSLVVLGSGESWLEDGLRQAAAWHPGQVAAVIGHDEQLAHLIYGAADALAVPSRFEPCGLSQMIAMRYGTLPIARATGGLKDTIIHDQDGFLFTHANPEGLLWAAGQARRRYAEARWEAMMERAMTKEFSWARSAQAYGEVYRLARGG